MTRRTVAVVEDNPDNRLLVRVLLERTFELVEYENGLEALTGFAGAVPDLVLLDMQMPGIDGLEVVRRMRDDPILRAVPVVALTAHAMLGDRERYLAAGCDGYVSKPIEDLVGFRALVSRYIDEADAKRAGSA